MSPRARLTEGALLLGPVLWPYGFEFVFRAEGQDWGGEFAEGEFIRDDRRLALRFRRSISLVTYQVGAAFVTHAGYMTAIGVRDCLASPDCSEDPLAGFLQLASDLARYAEDFLSGDGEVVIRAAVRERARHEARYRRFLTGFVDDVLTRARAHREFGARDWITVIRLLESLRYPDQMETTEHRKLEISRRHCGDHRRIAAAERWEQVVRSALAATSAEEAISALDDGTTAGEYGEGVPRTPQVGQNGIRGRDDAPDELSTERLAEICAQTYRSVITFLVSAHGISVLYPRQMIRQQEEINPGFDPNDAA